MIVTADHLRQARAQHGGYCVTGLRIWFDRNNLDLKHFLQHGYPVDVIEAVGDEFSSKVVAIARSEAA